MAVGTIAVVLVSVIGSLTFLPATLAILGDRVNLGRPAPGSRAPRGPAARPLSRWGRSALGWLDERASRPEGSGFWARLVNCGDGPAGRDDGRLGGAPARARVAGPPPAHRHHRHHGLPRSIDGVAGDQAAQREVAAGHGPHASTSSSPTPTGPTTQAAIEQLKTEGLEVAGLSGRSTSRTSKDGKVALVSFTMAGGRNDEANRAIVRQVRGRARPAVFGAPARRPQLYVTGDAACTLDVDQDLHRRRRRGSSCSCSGCRSC